MTTNVEQLSLTLDVLESTDAIEYAQERQEHQSESFLTQHQINDAETERLLGMPLPKERRVSQAYERQLLHQIEEGDEQATLKYLVARARTIYTAVSQIPEASGLTMEDYFQIGCEIVVDVAKKNRLEILVNKTASRLYGVIHTAVEKEIKAQQLAPSEVQILPLSEDNGGTEPGEHLEGLVKATEGQSVCQVINKRLWSRDARMLELHYGLDDDQPQTLAAVGRRFNITHERVRQIEKRALKELNQTIPADHFLRTPLVAGMADHQDIYAARHAQEKAAAIVQKQRERRAVEESLLANYPGDPQNAPRQERLIGGLAEVVIKILRAQEHQQPGVVEKRDINDLRRSVTATIENGRHTIRHSEFIRSLNLLSDADAITWIQPENSTDSFVKPSH